MTGTRSFSKGTPQSLAWPPNTNRFHNRDLSRWPHLIILSTAARLFCALRQTLGSASTFITPARYPSPFAIDPSFPFQQLKKPSHVATTLQGSWFKGDGSFVLCNLTGYPYVHQKWSTRFPRIFRLSSHRHPARRRETWEMWAHQLISNYWDFSEEIFQAPAMIGPRHVIAVTKSAVRNCRSDESWSMMSQRPCSLLSIVAHSKEITISENSRYVQTISQLILNMAWTVWESKVQ